MLIAYLHHSAAFGGAYVKVQFSLGENEWLRKNRPFFLARVERHEAVAPQHGGLRSAVLMTAATRSGDLGGAEAQVREALRGVPVPPATQIEIGGQAASARSARNELIGVALTAVVLVLLILILQLHSLRYALVVLIGAPLSTVGGLLVLALAGIPLVVSSMTGPVVSV